MLEASLKDVHRKSNLQVAAQTQKKHHNQVMIQAELSTILQWGKQRKYIYLKNTIFGTANCRVYISYQAVSNLAVCIIKSLVLSQFGSRILTRKFQALLEGTDIYRDASAIISPYRGAEIENDCQNRLLTELKIRLSLKQSEFIEKRICRTEEQKKCMRELFWKFLYWLPDGF